MLRGRTKQKSRALSGAAATIADRQFYGDEPTFDEGHVLTPSEEIRCYNWYSYILGASEAREFLTDFLKEMEEDELLEKFERIPDWAVPLTAAWVVRIESRGFTFEADKTPFVLQKIVESFRFLKEEDKPQVFVAKSREKVIDLISDIEVAIDAHQLDFNCYEFLSSNSVSSKTAREIIEYYEPLQSEISEAIAKKDPQIVEAYSRLKPKELKDYHNFVTGIITDAEKFTENKKATRKPRKKKIKSADAILKFMLPKAKDDEHKIVSVSPERILGAQEVWLFNCTYKILTVLRTADEKGLGVHRTAITNYDEKTSVSKRIGRRADEHIQTVLSGGKVARRKLMDAVKTAAIDIKDRVSNDVVLLYAIRN